MKRHRGEVGEPPYATAISASLSLSPSMCSGTFRDIVKYLAQEKRIHRQQERSSNSVTRNAN